MTNELPTVGFIGLGSMGSGMTRNLLLRGYPLVVHDERPEAADALVDQGAVWAETPGQVATHADLVITMLPTPAIIRQVVLAPGGLLDGFGTSGTWIDMSTSVPAVLDEVRAVAGDRELTIIDAPVSGMAVGAAAGTLQIFVGAEPDDFERILPVLQAMGDPERILRVGGPGSGYAVKLLINQLWFSQLIATAEVLSVGVKAGVDIESLRTALVASPATSRFVETDILSVLDNGDYDEGFALALACKDLGLSVDLARSVGVSVELSALVEQVYRRARARYGDRAGEMAPMRLYEELTGQLLRRGHSFLQVPPGGEAEAA